MKPLKKPVNPVKKSSNDAIKSHQINKQKISASSLSLFDILENHFDKNQRLYLIVILGLAFTLSFLCFDAKISLANDDALYIESGARYAKDFFAKESFYLANAPLYPTLLGLIIKVFGVNLMVLKCFSILFF